MFVLTRLVMQKKYK